MGDESKQIAEESGAEEPLEIPPEVITSSYAKKWYDTGFVFAVNYIYAKLEYWDPEFTQAKFKTFCDRNLDDVIDEKYLETYDFYKDPEIITLPQARKWYDIGFTFAVNYIYAKLAESTDPPGLTQAKFKMFCDNRLGNVIDLTYFQRLPFFFTVGGQNPYGAGQCPGDLPNTCIPCTTGIITPLRRPGSTE